MNAVIFVIIFLNVLECFVNACAFYKAPSTPTTPLQLINKVLQTRNSCQPPVQTTVKEQRQSLFDDPTAQRIVKSLPKNVCVNAEISQYECEFTFYGEVSLATVPQPTNCGAAITIQVAKPRLRIPTIDVAYVLMIDTLLHINVTGVRHVVYDVVTNQPKVEIKAFNSLKQDNMVTDLVAQQVAADPDGDFLSTTVGFAGIVNDFASLPPELNQNDSANRNNVAALAFTFQVGRTTKTLFKVPCSIDDTPIMPPPPPPPPPPPNTDERSISIDQIVGPPGHDNFAVNLAAGSSLSVDIAGAANDHPLRRFPDTYSFPLTLDPVEVTREIIYDGELTVGVLPKFCDNGDLGCNCRGEPALTRCNYPYECNSIGYCVRSVCSFGEAGCKVANDSLCTGVDLVPQNGSCIVKNNCKLGSLGCLCNANSTCVVDGDCLDGFCVRRRRDGTCTNGDAGCNCVNNSTCTTDGTICSEKTGMCVFKSCTAGSKGCSCLSSDIKQCKDGGFSCVAGVCVQTPCELGSVGCSCLPGKKCAATSDTCVELVKDGSQTVCVVQNPCPGNQLQRCLDECGAGNIAVCGKCSYSRPICKVPVSRPSPCSWSYLYGNPCVTTTVARSRSITLVPSIITVFVTAFITTSFY